MTGRMRGSFANLARPGSDFSPAVDSARQWIQQGLQGISALKR